MKKKKSLQKDIPKTRLGNISVLNIKSGFKYVYITAFFVLLSGFFHPIITETSFDGVIAGTIVLFVGLFGGILLYKAASAENNKTILLGSGFGLLAISFVFIFQLTGRV